MKRKLPAQESLVDILKLFLNQRKGGLRIRGGGGRLWPSVSFVPHTSLQKRRNGIKKQREGWAQ